MPSQDLSQLAAAIRSCQPGDMDGIAAIHQKLHAALEACDTHDPSGPEALLSCLLETFSATGDNGRAALDDMVLELLPAVAGLAQASAACSKLLSAFCNLVAAACSPRDTITAFLEVLGIVIDSSAGPDSLQFACDLLLLLPHQVAKLSRRKAANALECCVAAGRVAQVHGEVLSSWTLTQLALAAQQSAACVPSSSAQSAAVGTLNKLDMFLAANWQAYIEFAQQMLHKVVLLEADPEVCATARRGLSTLVLQLLQHLTSIWPPQALRVLTLQVLTQPGTAQLMPSTDSVVRPEPLLARQQHTASMGGSAAEAAVLELLLMLQECGVSTWQQLHSLGDNAAAAAAGAGLAALYSSCIEGEGSHALVMPGAPLQATQFACGWCCAIVDASDGNALSILKAIALVQGAAGHAKHQQLGSPAVSAPPPLSTTTGSSAVTQPPSVLASGIQHAQPEHVQLPGAEAAASTSQLLPALQPCVTLLAGVVAHAPVQALRSQAALALQQQLQSLPPAVCYACLRQLLSTGPPDGLHPEVAALLMQEVRSQLATTGRGPTCFHPAACLQLVAPWLLQMGPVGWHKPDSLPDRANAICAALAVLRLGLLRGAQAVARGTGHADEAPGVPVEELKPALVVLSAAVVDELEALQAENQEEQQGVDGDVVQEALQGSGAGGGDGRQRVAGEAEGSGRAVDAWLAVSRVQDVLDRVLEML